jgi:hypothetical protein
LWPFKRSFDLGASIKCFERGLRDIQVTLFVILRTQYSAEMDGESARVLAAQVVNYLKGEDVESVIASTPEPLKSQICLLRNRIPERARGAMDLGKGIREVVVATLRMRTVLGFWRSGDSYFQSDEMKRIEGLLSIYGPEFPQEINPKAYLGMARRFRESHGPSVQ